MSYRHDDRLWYISIPLEHSLNFAEQILNDLQNPCTDRLRGSRASVNDKTFFSSLGIIFPSQSKLHVIEVEGIVFEVPPLTPVVAL